MSRRESNGPEIQGIVQGKLVTSCLMRTGKRSKQVFNLSPRKQGEDTLLKVQPQKNLGNDLGIQLYRLRVF